MAQKVQIILIDDLDGGAATDTVTFGLDGVTYEIDLAEENAAKLRDSLTGWVANARRVSGRSSAGRSSSRSAGSRNRGDNDTAAVREWAKNQGMTVSERGRISATVREAYDRAH